MYTHVLSCSFCQDDTIKINLCFCLDNQSFQIFFLTVSVPQSVYTLTSLYTTLSSIVVAATNKVIANSHVHIIVRIHCSFYGARSVEVTRSYGQCVSNSFHNYWLMKVLKFTEFQFIEFSYFLLELTNTLPNPGSLRLPMFLCRGFTAQHCYLGL